MALLSHGREAPPRPRIPTEALERHAAVSPTPPRQARNRAAGTSLCSATTPAATLLRASLVLALLSLIPAGLCAAQAQVSREYDVKAVFLLNFAQFVEWPAAAFSSPESPLIIGVLGVDPFSRTLDDVVENETVRGRQVVPKRFRRVEDVDACHILFISASEERRLPQILAALKNRPILTVSDMDGFVSRGGMIELYTEKAQPEEPKVRLHINNDAARAADLVPSAKLLRVARTVGNKEPD